MDEPVLRSVPESTTDEKKPARATSTKVRPKRALPTDRMKFEIQIDALRAFVLASRGGVDAVTSEDIATHVGVTAATAGLNNIFFMDSGLLTREFKGRYKPVPEVVEFHRELGWGESNAAAHLAPILAKTWYYAEAENRDTLGPCTRAQMASALANAAKADASDMPKAELLVDWLVYVGLIEVDGDNVLVHNLRDVEGVSVEHRVAQRSDAPTPPADPKGAESTVPSRAPARSAAIVSLALNVSVTAEDMAKLAPEQIASLFDGIGKVAAIQAALKDTTEG